MSKKQWMVLLMLFLTYLLLGASIFYHIESRLEIERMERAKQERIEINALLHEHYVPNRRHNYDEILGKLTQYCGKSVYNYTEGETDPLKWDFYNSFYFAYTVVSTIGYGNLAPTNMLCRILMIFYGLIGIPMNGILLTQLGEFFGRVFVKAHEKYKSYKHGRNDYFPKKLTTFKTRKVGLAAQIFVHLMPGFVMFIFFPAFLFSHYEGWSYDEAVYYAFVTLTTIGFGDYVAGQDNSKGNGIFFILYKAFLICWISFGLGYTVMIMTFIARGMRSKKITRIEHKLAINLKHTQSKIWNELNKEMNYLRRVFNELQLSKVKRVYVDECEYEVPLSKFPRSNSFPDLRNLLYGEKEDDGICYKPRRRANSEVVPTEDQITRVVSETDLQRIDKTATFATHAMIQPAELLARLVNILGYIPPATEDTTDTYEKELPTEKEPMNAFNSTGHGAWTIGHEKIPRFFKPRSRTASEIRLRETRYLSDRNVERTWSGPTAARKMQQLIKEQTTNESSNKDRGFIEGKLSKFRSFALAKSVPKALIPSGSYKNWFSSSFEKKHSESGLTSGNVDKRRDSRSSVVSNSTRHYYTHTGAANTVQTENSNLLEETSVADFLRALTILHASVANTDSWTGTVNATAIDITDDDRTRRNQPRRKMGTASLTPPKLPSLFTLFSPIQSSSTRHDQESSVNDNITNSRRSSSAFIAPTVTKSRRFSLRPVTTPISPPTPPNNGSPSLSRPQRTANENGATFSFESSKKPLIPMEQAPGLSSPMKSSLASRRFSLRPTTTNHGISTGNAVVGSATNTKVLPRWKAGMLQRQIGQMNLRRARAFSLSDVQPDDPRGKIESSASSFNMYKRNIRDATRKNISSHETSNTGENVSRFAEIPNQLSSSISRPDKQNSFLRETNRLDDKKFRIIDPYPRPTSFKILDDKIDRFNEPTSFSSSSSQHDDSISVVESGRKQVENTMSLFGRVPDATEATLVELKVQNPDSTDSGQRSFSKSTANDDSMDNSTDLTGLTIEKHRTNSRATDS
ncbi:open rectifier K[+] channel 1 isoform X2 [Megachile rotundata]|uniref:open rectifier K[+] channel 1 isoform X2 n=1 Tax=Megachile rotundata TaxID=143995 RepID=UPI000614BC37|nr:PREDICTED: open rectifier potassium channel protein 1 isoform X2 [Megachile rotundata]